MNRSTSRVLRARLAVVVGSAMALGAVVTGASAPADAATPTTPGAYVSLPPARVLDTRTGFGGTTAAADGTVALKVAGQGGIPTDNVSAVVLNITATGTTATGFVTVYPEGSPRPTASNLNFVKGRTVANLVTVPMGLNGTVYLYNGALGTTQLVADVASYYIGGTPAAAGTFTPLTPSRLLDTRTGLGGTTPAANSAVALQITGRDSIPTGSVSAVVLNVTANNPTAAGYLTVYAHGAARPTASNLNFVKGQTIPNLVVAPVSAGGAVDLYNGSLGTTQIIADIAGYYLGGTPTASGTFVPLSPARALDTRIGLGGITPAADSAVPLQVTGPNDVPAGASAVVLNVTANNPTAAGYVTAYADGAARPTASNLNFVQGQTVPNLVIAPVGVGGKVDLYNGSLGTTQLIADISGYFVSGATPPDTTPPGPVTSVTTTSTTSSVSLSWTNPTAPDFTGVIIRRSAGATAPTSPTAGTAVTDTSGATHAFTDSGLSPSTQYSYALFAHDGVPNYAAAATRSATTAAPPDTTPPGPVSGVAVSATSNSVVLSWTNPTDADFAGVTIRRAVGNTAPSTVTSGTPVTTTAGSTHQYVDASVVENTTYSYALFARDTVGNSASGQPVTATTTGWLQRINVYRAAAGLAPVTAEPAWDAGLQAHFHYLALNPTGSTYRTGDYANAHYENPNAPGYTAAGDTQGRQSDLVEGRTDFTPSQFIDGWLSGPFHSIGMLRAALAKVEFAYDPTTGDGGLNVIGGLTGQGSSTPILFPGNGMTTNLTSYTQEVPDPLESCPNGSGFSAATAGLPVYASLPNTPVANLSVSVTAANGSHLSTCVVDELNYHSSNPVYGQIGLQLLQSDHLVLIFAKTQYAAGTYTARINQPGQAAVTWSFTVGANGPQSGG